jgi:hypothetical protein
MPKQHLRNALDTIREALDDPKDLDLSDRELMITVRDDIQELLELSSEVAVGQKLQTQRGVASAIERFEERHPQLTRMLGSVAEALSSMGI